MSPVARVLLALIKVYRRWISPLLGAHCRFAPTCSGYALQAVTEHGPLRGSWLTLCRLSRCQPFHPGGHDPVPPRRSSPSSIMATSRTPPLPERTSPRPGAHSC